MNSVQTEIQIKSNGNDLIFPASTAVRNVMNHIVLKLRQLASRLPESPLEKSFREGYDSVCRMIDEYQRILLESSDYSVRCKSGCCSCCNHWVEDVNSFEAEIIADFIKTVMPHRLDQILRQSRDDCRELEHLQKMVDDKLALPDEDGSTESIDNVDLLLGVFYQMKRPCPLLRKDGTCSIYPIRPITCRIYVSFSDPMKCDPEYIIATESPTAILDLSEIANELLDSLHFRYIRFDGDTGLRSLLLKYLDTQQSD